MPMVDPWGSTNQGLAQLGNTFDDLNARRRQEIQDTLMMERNRREAEKDTIGMESARMTLDEQQRKAGNLRAYDDARKTQEAGFATATVPTDVPDPAYKPPVPEGLNSTMTYAGEANEPIPAQPAVGLPTMSGSRPMNDNEKIAARAQLAFQHGDWGALAKMGHWVDLTDKMEGREFDKIKKALEIIDSASDMPPQVQLAVAKKVSASMGVPENIVEQMVTNSRVGGIATPVADASGKVIGNMIVTREGGKRKVLFNKLDKEVPDKYGTASTAEGVITYDKGTGQPGTRLGSPTKTPTDPSVRADEKEDKRKVKALTEARKEVEKGYGFSQFLPSAQDPKLIEKVGKGKAVVEDILDNYKDYGLKNEPTPGKAASMAKTIVDNQYKKPAATAVPTEEDKKSKSIREMLFGPGTK